MTFKNRSFPLFINDAFGFTNGAGLGVGGTAGISGSSSTGLNGVTPLLLKKSPDLPTSGFTL